MKCWWIFFHSWPVQWSEPKIQTVLTDFGEGKRSVQTRACKKCGKLAVRHI